MEDEHKLIDNRIYIGGSCGGAFADFIVFVRTHNVIIEYVGDNHFVINPGRGFMGDIGEISCMFKLEFGA